MDPNTSPIMSHVSLSSLGMETIRSIDEEAVRKEKIYAKVRFEALKFPLVGPTIYIYIIY